MPLSWQSRVDTLLRGALPDLVRSAGKVVFDRYPGAQAVVPTLKEKLRQQATRVAGAETQAEMFDELAETLDAVLALAAAHGISADQLAARRRERQAPSATSVPLTVFRPTLSSGLNALRWVLLERGNPQRSASATAAQRAEVSVSASAPRARVGLRSRARLRALGAQTLLRSAVSQLGAAPRTLMRPVRMRPQPITSSPRARLGVLHARSASAAIAPAPLDSSSRYLPVVVVTASSTAAVWFVAVTSRAVFRYVVRPYLVRYAHGGTGGTRLDQGSRALVRIMLPSLAT